MSFFGRGQMARIRAGRLRRRARQGRRPRQDLLGYHLIEVLSKVPGGAQPLAQVRESIRARLAAERVQQLAETQAKEIAGRVKKERTKNPETLQAIAKDFPGADLRDHPQVRQGGPHPGRGPLRPLQPGGLSP